MNTETHSLSTILFVHGSAGPSTDIIRELEEKGYRVSCTPSIGMAREMIMELPLSGIIADFNLPKASALEILCFLRKMNSLPFVVIQDEELGAMNSVEGFLNCLSLKHPVVMEDLIHGLKKLTEEHINGKSISQKINFMDSSEKYVGVELELFLSGKHLPYDVFIRLSEQRFVRIARESDGFSDGQLEKLKNRGVRELYLEKEDFTEYMAKNVQIIRHLTDAPIEDERKGMFIKQTARLVSEKIIGSELGLEGFDQAREVVDSTLNVMLKSKDLLLTLELLKNSPNDIYAHSLNVSIYSVLIAKKFSWKAPATLKTLSLAGLFHDVGMSEIPEDLFALKPDERNPAESELVQGHIDVSLRILCRANAFEKEVLTIIAQHHENDDGSGYPMGLSRNGISPLAKIVRVADEFCHLMADRQQNYQGIIDTISEMEAGIGKIYDENAVRALRSIFMRKSSAA